MPDKQLQAKDIKDGQAINDLFLVKEMNRGETKAGKPYLSLSLMDASGEIGARVWDNADQLMGQCPVGAIVAVTGQAQAYKGIIQLKIDAIQRVAENEVDPALFVPSTSGDIKLMSKELLKIISGVENPFLKELLLAIFGKKSLMRDFAKAPAAKAMHHAYVGGLLEHTLAVARLAEQVSALYPGMDRSLLISGALLHDIGKLKEFDFSSYPADYSDSGRLMGHMVLGIEMIQEKIDEVAGFPKELAVQLKHLILSHHGRHEFGSPTLPMMTEAFVLNFLDDLDAKVNYMGRLAKQIDGENYQWTDYQRNLERFLFIKGHKSDELNQTNDQETDIDPRQHRLF
ncbi:MAG: HD domain-containing protein [Desulfobulbaceae bacterium]|nr:HD domain-containing protein [Desulfobulbaceae bacterium]